VTICPIPEGTCLQPATNPPMNLIQHVADADVRQLAKLESELGTEPSFHAFRMHGSEITVDAGKWGWRNNTAVKYSNDDGEYRC
jgi:hypothetical protein